MALSHVNGKNSSHLKAQYNIALDREEEEAATSLPKVVSERRDSGNGKEAAGGNSKSWSLGALGRQDIRTKKMHRPLFSSSAILRPFNCYWYNDGKELGLTVMQTLGSLSDKVLVLLLIFSQVQIIAEALEPKSLSSNTFSPGKKHRSLTTNPYPSTSLSHQLRRTIADDTVALIHNPATIYRDWHSIQPSSTAILRLLNLHDQIQFSLSNLDPNFFAHNDTIALIYGDFHVTFHLLNRAKGPSRRSLFAPTTEKQALDQIIMDFHQHVLRGSIGFGSWFRWFRDGAGLAVLCFVFRPRQGELYFIT
ncbi:MAG: hypothetical protein Q9223_006206 [Gallowayella weberi]